MWLFKRHKRERELHEKHMQHSTIEVIHNKKQTHESIAEADKINKRLNALLKNDGVTLRIHIASVGSRNVR